jgi:HAD superfamily hydrolase (TIGR01509 family)
MLCHGIEFGVTAKSEIRFKQVAPINEPIQASAWVTKLTKRLVETKGVLTLKDNTVIVDGDFLFYVWRQSKKTILWDMDGVIADSYSFHFAAWQETFAKRGIKIMVQEKEENFRRKATGSIKPFPGAVRLLNAMKKGNFKLGLVSSAPKENINLVLSELNLEGIFDCIVFGQEVSESKPDPQVYLLAARKLEATPNDCLVIEDSPLGVKAAKTAGMKCLAIANTHPRQKLGEADKVFDSLENVDLITLLMRV